ncbi:hypothetical protein LK07_30515 [Streptomyces pluripotens]|uniref:Uncharacterized protein n=1 Tax=Streptomyces pluripotens TaxID=1355015 RepID=A0A221P5T0_9ACTN|nr:MULTISPECIES: hypothetical protein [Streptomyces]ARP73403.1 hypothetical protein LK06_029335 [Streptomyces pluripotens]ASN27653.1 hypothetical protein LK07_30515 [Streptomyces pluripotens]KIE24974.1 hypothetical protein LK08_21740 [Streptomyces sp. MUSC 125]MCH0561115.1 hypothetical protein [Streptomyces sp. MUM 16J]
MEDEPNTAQPRRVPLDDPNIMDKGLNSQVIPFPEVSSRPPVSYAINEPDHQHYRMSCYAVAETLVPGREYTISPPRGGTLFHSMADGCQGGCDGAPWYLGFDPGFAALAGVRILEPDSCAPALAPDTQQDLIREALVASAGSRCAQTLHFTTASLAARQEPPGCRTVMALMSNWTAWVSCSIYDALVDWSADEGPATVAADTLGTSKIRFVDADLRHTGRPHPSDFLHKGTGWEDEDDAAWVEACRRYGMRGIYQRPTVGLGVLAVDAGVYGRTPMAWSTMLLDSQFYYDYNFLAENSPSLGWWRHVQSYARKAVAASDTYLGAFAAGCSFSYGALYVKQRREQEARRHTLVRRGGVVWEDPQLWSSYLVVDSGAEQWAVGTGGCTDDLMSPGVARVVNDVIDLGYDWASGDMCNSILTLTGGKTGREDLTLAYRKLASVLNRTGTLRSDTMGGIAIASTYAWQIADTRHRGISCALVSDDPGIGPTTTMASWHQAVLLGDIGHETTSHDLVPGTLHNHTVTLTQRTWDAIGKHPAVGTLLYYGHCWPLQQRAQRRVPSTQEVYAVEQRLRVALLEAVMELDRADYVEAIWCWTLESFCATDLMWHAMIGSTAVAADRHIGSDRLSDDHTMQQWTG